MNIHSFLSWTCRAALPVRVLKSTMNSLGLLLYCFAWGWRWELTSRRERSSRLNLFVNTGMKCRFGDGSVNPDTIGLPKKVQGRPHIACRFHWWNRGSCEILHEQDILTIGNVYPDEIAFTCWSLWWDEDPICCHCMVGKERALGPKTGICHGFGP